MQYIFAATDKPGPEKKPELVGSDEKTLKTAPPLKAQVKAVKALLRVNGGKGRHNEVKLIMVTNTSAISGNATAQAPVFPVQPGAASEFASVAAMFDEYIVDAVECFFNVSTPNSQTGDVDFAVAYDPLNSGAYSSVVGVLEASQFRGPYQHGNTGKACTPVCMNNTGFFRWLVRLPKGAQITNPVGGTDSVGVWVSTATTSTVFGNIKGYVTASSAGVATTMQIYMRIHCRFRQRS